ncbi:MAG: TetR/AcrR family transcriptional regulator, partial [Saprospiraceae bacterium]
YFYKMLLIKIIVQMNYFCTIMNSTKQKILNTAITLFNENGMVNVSIRDISNEIQISPGNLTYHFKNKPSIIEAIHNQMKSRRFEILKGISLTPSIVNINAQIQPLLDLYYEYKFFYLDLLEIHRAYPAIAEKYRIHAEQQIDYIEAMLMYSVQSGNMTPEPSKGFYRGMSHTVWMILSFWLNQQIIRGKADDHHKGATQAMWNLVIPHLTEKGMKNFKLANSELTAS